MKALKTIGNCCLVFLTVIAVCVIIAYVYYHFFVHDKTVGVNYVDNQIGLDIQKSDELTEEEKNEFEERYFIEANFYSNAKNNGIALQEMKLNYFTDYKLLSTSYRSTGMQYLGDLKQEDLQLVATTEEQATRDEPKNFTYYDTTNGINWDGGKLRTQLNRETAFIISIDNKPYQIQLDKTYEWTTYERQWYTLWIWNKPTTHVWLYNYLDVFADCMQAIRSNSAGYGDYYITVDLSEYFTIRAFDTKSGKFKEDDVTDIIKNYSVLKFHYDENGARNSSQSLFKCIDCKPAVPENPTKENHEFVGWSLDGTNTVNVADTIITENTIFTAIFKINEYTVTFKDGETELSKQQIKHGEFASAPESPTKENYTFAGWSVDGTNTVDVGSYAITENTTFTAVFNINKYTVAFKDGETELSTQQVEHGKFASVPETPIKDGYTFVGWSVDGTNTVDVGSYAITENTTFIAVFKQAGKPYSLGFDTLGYGSMSSFDYDCVGEALTGETVTFSLTLLDLSDKYDTYKPLKISRVVLQDENGEEIFDLDEINGVGVMNKVGEKYEFSFELPEEYAGQYITIMVYLLPLDG